MNPPENCKPFNGLKNCIIGIFAAHDKGPVQQKCLDISHTISACWAALSKVEDADIRTEIEREIAAAMFKAIDLGAAVDCKHNRSSRTKFARATLQTKNSKRKTEHGDALLTAILDEVKERELKLACSVEFASRIQPGVCSRLGMEPGISGLTTPSAIKNRIRKISART